MFIIKFFLWLICSDTFLIRRVTKVLDYCLNQIDEYIEYMEENPKFKPSQTDLNDLKDLKDSLLAEKERASKYYSEVYWSIIRLQNNINSSKGIQYKIAQLLIEIDIKNKEGWEKALIEYETIFKKISQIEGASF